ncbi:MAG: hypothetical protein ACJ0O0_01720, partial [Flavobacteriaceae bacterium]
MILILITSCGSYQYSGYINDGIYQGNEPTEKYVDTEKPKLVVAIVVDQMRYDFLENLSNRFTEN